MPAKNQPVEMPAGDSRTIRIPVLDDEGRAVDLTGASARWWAAPTNKTASGSVPLKKSSATGGGITISIETVGGVASVHVLNIRLVPADTQNLAFTHGYHEAEVIDDDGNVATVTTGPFILTKSLIPPA